MHSFSTLFRCICFFYFLPLLIWADQNSRNITLGSTLTAGDDLKPPWLSPSGDFAFGFQRAVVSGGFLVAIWYNRIPDKTVTWSANRDELAQQGSKLQLTSDGLVLTEPNGNEMSIATGSGVAYANMLDTGNFVLGDKNGDTLWQSFDWPTDTILPTQIMAQGTQLIARISDTNYSSGRFKLIMQDDGNLVSYTLNWPQQSIPYYAYFATSTVGSGYKMVFNQSGPIYVEEKNNTIVANVLSSSMFPTQYLYQRAILEFDGVFRKYVYPRSNQSMNWTVQDFQPQDICRQMKAVEGGGACGFNSYCQMGGDQKPKCGCPRGYSFFDEVDPMKGCKRDFIAQSCLGEQREDDQFELQEMDSADFWGLDFESFLGISEMDCRESCLSDCLCAAAVFNGQPQRCWKKRFPLSNGWVGPDVEGKSFIKVRIGNSTTDLEPNQGNVREVKHQGIVLVESLFLGSSVFLNICLLTLAIFIATLCRRKRKEKKSPEHQDIAGTSMRNFSYKELQEATNGFKEVIGQGAFAIVYKGSIDLEQGRFVAVKKLNDPIKESQREFECEVKAIAKTGHRNLVQLIGFCNEQEHRLLVYEYMPNGSIADILFQDQRPNWFRRIKFAFETARGLNYLHEECNTQIIHCDIKPQNVLLDDSFTARISDFGLAKLMKKDQTHTLTGLRGTKGYVAPEWFRNMPITAKVDVYSYGILLLEIICCRRCFVAEMEDESQKVLVDWAFDCYREGRIDKLVEGDSEALSDIDKVKKCVMIALCCIRDDPFQRPSMSEVVQMIKGEVEESLPRNLSSYLTSLNVGCGDSQSYSTDNSYCSTERPLMKNGE